MGQLRNGSFHQSITVTVLFPVIPCLVSQLLGVIGMTIGERQNAAALSFQHPYPHPREESQFLRNS